MTRDFTNRLDNVQGGFLAAMLDDALGPALATTFEENQFAPTLELMASFIRAAKPGTIFGTGWVVHRGGSVASSRANSTIRKAISWRRLPPPLAWSGSSRMASSCRSAADFSDYVDKKRAAPA